MSEQVSRARRAALYVLSRCRHFDAWSAQTVQSAVQKFALDERDSALCNRLCRSVLQNAALCDYVIGKYCSQRPEKLQPQILDVLRLGAVQLLMTDRIPASAAVNEAVSLAKEINPKAAGLVNAVLRRIAELCGEMPKVDREGCEYLSVRYSHPLWLCEKIAGEYGFDFAESFFAANNGEAPVTVTVNSLVLGGEPCSKTLEGSGAIERRPDFAEGHFYVQDAAAAAAVRAAAPQKGWRVLDGCAAPGGKSFLAAMLMENTGSILSCDLHEKKLKLIEEGAQRLGIDIIDTVPMDGAKPYERLYGSFDLVLADVPCSGLGVIRKKPEIRYKKQEELSALPEKQLAILTGLSRCVKDGGVLLYSTCTILREENEGVTEAFLREHSEFTKEEDRTFWPHVDGTDGFYYCRMRKNG